VVIQRATDKDFRRATRSGKYKQFVLKFQMICNLAGVPLKVSGPHAGVRSDIEIFRENKPAVGPLERGLGDKAYYGDNDVEPPYKKAKGGSLTEHQLKYNIVHSWVRATVEHSIWQMKKFQILGGLFRGKVWKDDQPLQRCATIITRIVQMQTLLSPLRRHTELLDEEEIDEVEEKAAALRADREVIHGMVVGKVLDLRPVGGVVRGPLMNEEDTEPSDDDIDTGFQFHQFQKGARVLAFWWGLWWRGKVHKVAVRTQTLTIRFDWSNRDVSGYKPRCVYNFDYRG